MDRYELLEEVGTGGMAVVYRGRDTALDREVAVKLLHPHLAARAESRARFAREARAVARLKHPNIVEIFDYAGDGAVESYLVTEFVHGRTLRAFADAECLGQPEIAALLSRALADALAHAHAAGVIHRDLKPENVLVLESGGTRALKLVDFGIARILTSDERMTMTGALVGSPNHMAPEIIEGREADERSDVFSLGTILYWLATGRLPFAAPNPTATLRRVIDGDYEDPRRAAPTISEELAATIDRALANDPQRRTQTAAQLRDDLDGALEGAGLGAPGDELQALLADTRAYRGALSGRLVDAALRAADAALAAGDTARGMRLLDRVLALDPGNAAVTERLARLTARVRRRRRLRLGIALAAPLLVLAAAVGILVASRRSEPPAAVAPLGAAVADRGPGVAVSGGATEKASPSSAPSTVTELPPTVPELPRGPADSTALGAATPAPAVVRSDGAPGPTPARSAARPEVLAARAVSVQLHVRPYAQRALLDGVEVARDEQRVSLEFRTDAAHRIQVEHACCFPFVRDFAAGETIPQPLELKVPLRPRPARLRVDADPATRVYVDGKLAGTAGDSQRAALEVPVPSGGETPYEASAHLVLQREGAPPVTATLRVRAGADLAFAAAPIPVSTPPAEESAPGAPARDEASTSFAVERSP